MGERKTPFGSQHIEFTSFLLSAFFLIVVPVKSQELIECFFSFSDGDCPSVKNFFSLRGNSVGPFCRTRSFCIPFRLDPSPFFHTSKVAINGPDIRWTVVKLKFADLFDQFIPIRILPFQDKKNEGLKESGNSPFRTPTGILVRIYPPALLLVRMAHAFCLYMQKTYIRYFTSCQERVDFSLKILSQTKTAGIAGYPQPVMSRKNSRL